MLSSSYCGITEFYVSEVNVREQFIAVDKDDITVILEWDGILNPQYLVNVNVTVIPEVQVNISRSAAQLEVTYNVTYNVSVIISHPCGQNSTIIFSKVYYYQRTNACECSIYILFSSPKLLKA